MVDEIEEDPAAGTLRVLTWEISSGVDLSYSLDDVTGCSYVFVTAAIPSQRQAFLGHAEDSRARVVEALRDPHDDLREAAIYATSYTPARQYVPLLRDIARHDAVQELRDDAQNMLAAYAEAGILP